MVTTKQLHVPIRGFYIQKEFGTASEISIVKEINKSVTGNALIGLSSIVKNYGVSTDIFMVKQYLICC